MNHYFARFASYEVQALLYSISSGSWQAMAFRFKLYNNDVVHALNRRPLSRLVQGFYFAERRKE